MGNVNLRIDCSRLKLAQVEELARNLRRYLPSVFVAGGDLIYASGRINSRDYNNVWNIINRFDVTAA